MNKYFLMPFFLLFSIIAMAQPSFNARVENEKIVSDTAYEFDVYLYAINTPFMLTGQQYYFNLNTAFRNSSTVRIRYLAGSTDPAMVATGQTPNQVGYLTASNAVGITGFPPPTNSQGVIIPVTGLKVGRYRIAAISGTFDITKPANLRWRWSTPNSNLFYYNGSSSVSFVSNTIFSQQQYCFNPIYWDGTAWSGFVFSGTSNGAGAAVTSPTSSLDATTIAAFNASGNVSVRSLSLAADSAFSMQSYDLRLGYKLNKYNANFNIANSGLILTGNDTVTKNQSITLGATTTLRNLGFEGSGTKTITDTLNVTGTVSQSGTAVFNAGGKLVLKSNASGTARVAAVAQNSITGNVLIEQYNPPGKRAFRFLANPLSIPLPGSQIRDDIFVTGNGTGTTTLGTENSNGFDYTTSGNPSAFAYNTANGNSSLSQDPGWAAISNGNSSTIPVGGAWRVLIRGDRGNIGVLNGTVDTSNGVTMDFFGPINDGNAPVVTLSKTASSSFNFIGNSVNSNINSNDISSTVALSAGIWVWNQSIGTRGAYTTGIRSNNFVIPARAGFFLRVDDAVSTGSNVGTITIPEAAKTAAAASYTAYKGPNDKIVLNVHSTGVRWDELNIGFNDTYKAGTDYEDIDKLMNPDVNIFSINTDGKYLAIDQRKNESQNIALGFYTPGTLTFTFDFTGTIIPNDLELFFRDGNTLTPITENTKYTATIEGMNTINTTRFGIVVEKKATSLQEQQLLNNAYLLYPNPVSGMDKVNIAPKRVSGVAKKVNYQLIDMNGKMIQEGVFEFVGTNALELPTEDLAFGVYHIRLIQEESITNLSFIKK